MSPAAGAAAGSAAPPPRVPPPLPAVPPVFVNPPRRIAFDALVACPACDRLHRRVELEPGELARCARCEAPLQTRKPRTIDRSLAAALAALVLLALALGTPFLGLSRAGIESRISVLDAVAVLALGDFPSLGVVVALGIVVLPVARYALLVAVLAPLRLRRRARAAGPGARRAFRWALALEPWAMAEIFMVGVTVSLVKVGSLARLEVGLAFWAFVGLVAVSAYLSSVLCRDTIWRALG